MKPEASLRGHPAKIDFRVPLPPKSRSLKERELAKTYVDGRGVGT